MIGLHFNLFQLSLNLFNKDLPLIEKGGKVRTSVIIRTVFLVSIEVEAVKLPGSTVMTSIPNFLISILRASVKPSCPYFVIQNAELQGIPIFPLLLVTFTILPVQI